MRIDVKRFSTGPDDTLGRMYIDNKFVCYTLEDEYRKVKVMHETRIPDGTYRLTLRKEGGHHQRYQTRFKDIHQGMLWIRDIHNFKFVLIHCGNTEDHTSGCILVGTKTGTLKGKRAVLGSSTAYRKVYPIIAERIAAGEEVNIHIEDVEAAEFIGPKQFDINEHLAELMAPGVKKINGKYDWILDNGNGKETPGKRSPRFEDGTQLFEYHFNRKIVNGLAEELKNRGLHYHILVPGDNDLSLSSRANKANALSRGRPRILISVHGNGAGDGVNWHGGHGLETFHFPGSSKGQKLATVFQNKMVQHIGWRNRGVKSANFAILRRSHMPAILTENGFFTHYNEAKKMMDPVWQKKIITAHLEAILEIEKSDEHFG